MRTIGQSVQRVDVLDKVTGEAKYPGDYSFPNQLYMKVLFSARAHAIVKQVDISAASAIPGVVGIYTSKDVPVNEYGLIMPDQPVLCGPGSNKPFTDRVRGFGDQIAIVVAETETIAACARDAIKVTYEDLPIVEDPRESMQAGAILLHPERDSNIFCHYRIRKGDIDQGFASADVVVEGRYNTPMQEHAYLQPEAGVGYLDEDRRITVIVGGQWVHEDQEQIAHALNLPLDRIRVIYPAIGGAFGGREDMSVQIILALAVLKLQEQGIERPVKIVWSREESMIGHHKRHPFSIHTRWGATKDGKIVAAEIDMVADGGGYAYTSTKVLGNATVLCTGGYEVPNIKADTYAVYTNSPFTGAFRGFGGPQAIFAAEMQIEKIAKALNMDPIEIRRINALREGSLLPVGTPLPAGVTMLPVIERTAEELGWLTGKDDWRLSDYRNPNKVIRRGKGFACGLKNVGFSFGAPEHCWATIELYGEQEIDKAVLRLAGAEVGQGSHTVFAQFTAEALGIPISKIELITADTANTQNSGSASASRMTFMSGNAIIGAAEIALSKWKEGQRPVVATFQYRPPKTTMMDAETGKSEPNFDYGYVAEGVEVEVNVETGVVRLTKVVCGDDVGQAVNPQQVRGQVEGAIIQAAGYSIMENFVFNKGKVVTDKLSTYLIPTILDIPDEVQSIIIENADPIGPYGARGMGEMPYLCFAPAVVAAVYDATGVWFDEFPLTPERVLKGLGKL
jgi:CO/xanthine dehydrogenase Mo-binding subunit